MHSRANNQEREHFGHGRSDYGGISDGQDGSAEGVFGQRFDSSGAALGGEFQVNTATPYLELFGTSVVSDASDGFFVVWSSNQEGADFGVFARR